MDRLVPFESKECWDQKDFRGLKKLFYLTRYSLSWLGGRDWTNFPADWNAVLTKRNWAQYLVTLSVLVLVPAREHVVPLSVITQSPDLPHYTHCNHYNWYHLCFWYLGPDFRCLALHQILLINFKNSENPEDSKV